MSDVGAPSRRCIRDGGVALFPADTLYGLACDPLEREAIERIHALKGRDDGKPSAVMFFAPLELREVLSMSGPAHPRRDRRAAPGPVTLVVANPRGALPARLPRGPRRGWGSG